MLTMLITLKCIYSWGVSVIVCKLYLNKAVIFFKTSSVIKANPIMFFIAAVTVPWLIGDLVLGDNEERQHSGRDQAPDLEKQDTVQKAPSAPGMPSPASSCVRILAFARWWLCTYLQVRLCMFPVYYSMQQGPRCRLWALALTLTGRLGLYGDHSTFLRPGKGRGKVLKTGNPRFWTLAPC
jgi:hypothetical protein